MIPHLPYRPAPRAREANAPPRSRSCSGPRTTSVADAYSLCTPARPSWSKVRTHRDRFPHKPSNYVSRASSATPCGVTRVRHRRRMAANAAPCTRAGLPSPELAATAVGTNPPYRGRRHRTERRPTSESAQPPTRRRGVGPRPVPVPGRSARGPLGRRPSVQSLALRLILKSRGTLAV